MMNRPTFFDGIWKLLCSLKLAIVLASAATLVTMGGSLLIPSHPKLFGGMDGMPLGAWLAGAGAARPGLAWWVFAAAALLLLLGLNTLCCFMDWARNLRARWRKSGEYLIHLGFVLLTAAYLWGSLAGARSEEFRLFVGETRPIPSMPGRFLRLDAFEPRFAESGRPIDMLSTVVLLRGEEVIARQVVKTNFPLTRGSLVVVPSSFGRQPSGFRFFISGMGEVPLEVGGLLQLGGGPVLRVLDFLPDATPLPGGSAARRGVTLGDPAILLELLQPGREPWQGWYFLRGPIPYPLLEAGVRLWPTEPLYRVYSLFTVNRDPGAPLALAGAGAMLAGVLLAAGSFYYKRARGDRPEIG